MPRQKSVDSDAVRDALLKYKCEIINDDGDIAFKSNNIWNVISRELDGKITSLALYTIMKKNRYDVWNSLDYKQETKKEENVTSKDESSSSETSSNSSEQYVKFEASVTFEEFSSMMKESMYNCSEKNRKKK